MLKKLIAIIASITCLHSFVSNAEASTVTVTTGYGYYTLDDNVATPGNIDLDNLVQFNYYTKIDPATGTKVMLGGSTGLATGTALVGSVGEHIQPTGVANDDSYLYSYGYDYSYTWDGEYYLAHTFGTVTVEPETPTDEFHFTWGSIDNFNWLRVTRSNNQMYTVSGADILANNLVQLGPDRTKYFSLYDDLGVKRIEFQSYWSSFEAGNLSTVPLPAALPMFGAALIGISALRRRKQV